MTQQNTATAQMYPEIKMGGGPRQGEFPYVDQHAPPVSMQQQSDWGLACLLGWTSHLQEGELARPLSNGPEISRATGQVAAREWVARFGEVPVHGKKSWVYPAGAQARDLLK